MKKILSLIVLTLFFSNTAFSDNLFKLIEREEDPKSIISSDPNYDFEKALAKEVNDLSMYLGQSKNDEKIPLVGMFYQTLQSNSSKLNELSVNNGDHFIVSGCRRQSCSEKSLLWIDKKNKVVISAMLHYFLDTQATSIDENYLLIFSKKINSIEDLPEDFKLTLKTWISSLTQYDYDTGKDKPLIPTVINFINSKNERIAVKENIYGNKVSYTNIQTEYLKLTCSADTTWNSKGEKKSVWFAWAKDKLFVHMDKKKGLVVKLGYSKNKEDLFDHKIVYEKIKEEEDITAYKFITNTTSGNIINLITIREWDSRFYSFWMDQYRLDYKQIEAVKKLMIRNTFSEFKKAMEKESTGLFWNSLFGTQAGYCNHEIRKN